MKQLILGLIFLLSTSIINAAIQYELSDFMKEETSGGFGYVSINDNPYFKTTVNPNFSLAGLQVGLGVNLYIPMAGDDWFPETTDWLTLRYLGYDYQNKYGFKYGRLSNVTLGQGLLVDNFDTGSGGTSEFSNKKAGVLGYITILKSKITALYTTEQVYGARVERPITEVASTPVIVGATYMKDEDGINDASTGTTITRPEQEGYAADISYPIGGEFFTLFSEYAELIDQGRGVSSGARGSFFSALNYRAEYRILGKGFVPGYFNNTYQATGFNFSSGALKEELSGVLVNVSSNIMGEYAKAGLQYELYDDVNVLSAALGWRQVGPVTGVLNYSKPFNTGNDNAVLIGNFYYRTTKFYDLIFRVKRVYITSEEFTESYDVSFVFKFDRLLPSLPI